jgi:endonuclease/exonuclease/phosphatase family metal-dependent hydrolase
MSVASARSRWRVRGLLGAVTIATVVVLASSVPAMPAGAATTFVVLQMNLCNSGMARSCYSGGRSIDEAVANIHRYPPELVTVQEVCRNDLYSAHGWGKLAQAMADIYGSRNISVNFSSTRNEFTGGAYHGCINGEEYGVAMIHHGNGRDIHHGWYDSQDRSVEQRTWTCTTVIKGRLTACTTHLSIISAIALQECKELMIIMASLWVMPEVIISGDFNLKFDPGKPYDVRNCLPPNYDVRNDNALQQVLFTRNIQWAQGRTEPMKHTDHPLLYERFRA